MRELAQLKLIDGHEIVCEVVEWPDEKGEQFIIRNAMSIVVMETPDGDNAYVFRPFIHFLEDEKDFALLNSNHVLAMNRPKTYLSEQYDMSVQAMLESNRERLAEYEEAKQEGPEKGGSLAREREEPEELGLMHFRDEPPHQGAAG